MTPGEAAQMYDKGHRHGQWFTVGVLVFGVFAVAGWLLTVL
jgi:hypothetical protein